MKQWVIDGWYGKHGWLFFLIPFSWLFRVIIFFRRWIYSRFATRLPIPVIVVGNITIGGTGKTPFVIWLAEYLKQQGHTPGIISRGYGSRAPYYPYEVSPDENPPFSGDEPLLLARHTNAPVVISPNRVAAAEKLISQYPKTTIIISDDGLQHYALARDVEIVILDGERRLGNGYCLPAGPLREPASRLKTVDFVIVNGENMRLIPGDLCSIQNSRQTQPISAFQNKTIHAVAGIGNPQRFFNMLRELGLTIIEHPFPDHHIFSFQDLDFGIDAIIVMTEKDAVKCQNFNLQAWYLPVKAEVDIPIGFLSQDQTIR